MALLLSMKNIVAVVGAVTGALCLYGADAQLAVSSVRQPGATLDVSLRQELDHAVDLATAWLAQRQHADGYWGGETGRLWRTSVALLALSTRPSAHSDAISRAAVWLDRQPLNESHTSDVRAWRAVALLTAVPDTGSRAALAQRLLTESQAYVLPTNAPARSRELWDDVRTLAGIPPSPAPLSSAYEAFRLKELSENSARLTIPAPDCRWTDVRLINRAGGGMLLRDGVAVDWRRDVAQALIGAQQRDPAGGGYWPRPADDDRLMMTAFAVLDLMEL